MYLRSNHSIINSVRVLIAQPSICRRIQHLDPHFLYLRSNHCIMNSVHCEIKERETTTGVIGYVQIYPGGTERSAKRKGGVAGRSCVFGGRKCYVHWGQSKKMQCKWTYRFGCCSEGCYRCAVVNQKSLPSSFSDQILQSK